MGLADEVKGRLDIVAVISEYLRLDKSGKNFKAICPFHAEKDGSFFVFPERQGWHCFGCGQGGDVFGFIMKKEGLDFGSALKVLAQKAGVTLTPLRAPGPPDRLRELMEAAAAFYHQVLRVDAQALGAREYLKGRGIDEKTVADFGLGFSPPGGQALRSHLLHSGYRDEELRTAGLAGEKEGRYYDQFRGRLMFPIRDPQGRAIAFGARALDSSVPKYLNSPQTPLFDKGASFYGLDRARGAIREQGAAVIVEGYPDVVIAHQYGFRNVVGSMGTSLTPRQVDLLKGTAGRILLALDADVAGAEATRRGLEVARQAVASSVTLPTWRGETRRQAELCIVTLPTGRDPDEVIKADPRAWEKLVREAPTLVEYRLEGLGPLADPESKSRAAREVLPLIAELEDDVKRELYLGRLAQLLGVSDRNLSELAAKWHAPTVERRRGRPADARPMPRGEPLEEYCLALLLQQPQLRAHLQPEHFQGTANREVFTALQAAGSPDAIGPLDETLREYVDSLLARALPVASPDQLGVALAEVTRRLEERRLRLLKTQEEALLAELGDDESGQALQRALEVNEGLRRLFAQRAASRNGKG